METQTRKYELFGDGVHDDTAAIQELIDEAKNEVILPSPDNFYLISKPLVLKSNFRLVLPRYAEVRLAPQSNCFIVMNRTAYNPFTGFPDGVEDTPAHDIELCGGVWNLNNSQQLPNPLQEKSEDPRYAEYTGVGMVFYNIKNLKISSLTVKNPTNFGITLDTVSYFTVEDITFDYTTYNPRLINMDGVHLNGNCHFGCIRNLKGACFDDLVALNADEGTSGPITNIEIDGIFAENCHSAARLLCRNEIVEKIHISNVYGTYYQYCLGITKYYRGEVKGYFDSITFDNIYASKAHRPEEFPWPTCYVYPLIWIEKELHVKNLAIRTLHRRENNVPIDTVYIGKDAHLDYLILDDISTENYTGSPIPLLTNEGTVERLVLKDIRTDETEMINNTGEIKAVKNFDD